jgi:hypothetical protein
VFLADKIINGTVGSLTVDLKRPMVPRVAGRTSLFTYNRRQQEQQLEQARAAQGYGQGGRQYRTNFRARGRAPPRQAQEQRQQFIDYSSIPDLAFGNTGARVKIMRHIQFGKEHTYAKHGRTFNAPMFSIGMGGDFEFDTAEFRPLLRMKIRDVASLQVLPYPAIKIQRRMQLGTSGFGVRMSYECPLETLNRFYAPPARLLITMDDMVDTGLRLTQSGVEFNANKWLLNGNARIKAAGLLRLPSELPVDEEQTLIRFEAKRLGFKTRW